MSDESFNTSPCVWHRLRDRIPFTRLQSFSCYDVVTNRHALSMFWLCPDITQLELIWDQGCGFPDFGPWPGLETLRMHFLGEPTMCMYPSDIPSYDMLTTLSIFEKTHSSWFCTHMQQNVYFPKLRVFSLQLATGPPLAIYQFVHQHATLMEVNISLHPNNGDIKFSFSGLQKLIDGTGTWMPKDAKDKESSDIIGWRPDTIPSDGAFITFSVFAFARVPLHPEATTWRDSRGSPHLRYTATELALEIDDQDEWEEMGFTVIRLHHFLATMSPRFPALQVLRLGYHTNYQDWYFAGLMKDCAGALRAWPHLRKLAFCWGDLHNFTWRSWRRSFSFSFDSVEPPVNLPYAMEDDESINLHRWYPQLREGEPYTLEHVRKIYGLSDAAFVDVVRDVESMLAETLDLDKAVDDPRLLMRAWQVFCEKDFVAPMMRLLAKNCPTLEEIEWYPVGPFFVDYAVRWLWRVHRQRNGTDVRMVNGELTYKGSLKGNAPHFEVLVGQELDTLLKDHQCVPY